MWFFRWFGVFVLALFLLSIALQNTEITEFSFYTWNSGPVPVYWIVFCSFGVGMIIFLLVAAYNQVQHRVELKRYKERIRSLQEEIDRLRIISLEEGLSEVEEMRHNQARLLEDDNG